MADPAQSLSFDYAPDGRRAEALDERVRGSLSRSLSAVAGALEESGAADATPLVRLSRRVDAGPVPPSIFARYTDLVQAISCDDEVLIRKRTEVLADPKLVLPVERRVVNFAKEPLGEDLSELYLRIFDDDLDLPLGLRSVSDDEFQHGRRLVEDAFELLDQCRPEMAREVRAFINEIVLSTNRDVEPPPGFSALCDFGSGTSLYLWGAAFIDPVMPGRVAMAETLVHEAAHCLLLALTDAGDLVKNDKSERYGSPLRTDMRPMEGIVHATYVLGRMMTLTEQLAACKDLSPAEREDLDWRHHRNTALFKHSVQTLRKNAIFTEEGAAALEGCLALGERLHN